LNTAYGRFCEGLQAASISRYAIYIEPAVLGFYFFLVTLRRGTTRNFLLSGFLIAVVAASLYRDPGGMGFAWNVKQHWKACYLQTEDIEECNRVAGFPIYPNPQQTHLRQKLEYLKTTRQNLYLDEGAKKPGS
jgi:hypothetical protein